MVADFIMLETAREEAISLWKTPDWVQDKSFVPLAKSIKSTTYQLNHLD